MSKSQAEHAQAQRAESISSQKSSNLIDFDNDVIDGDDDTVHTSTRTSLPGGKIEHRPMSGQLPETDFDVRMELMTSPDHYESNISRSKGRSIELNDHSIRQRLEEYFHENGDQDEDWLSMPELPNAYEIAGITNGDWQRQDISLRSIDLNKPWESVEAYLENFYTLMREDAVSSLAEAVWDQRAKFAQLERESEKNARIYERVYISGLVVAAEGIAHRLDFSTGRAKNEVSWPSSKRLKPGTIVALTSVTDKFDSQCLIAVVAARSLSQLESTPPSVDVYFSDPNLMEINPQVEYLMVEASNGYFEACRHTLKALQHMAKEKFPLSEHVVSLDRKIVAPISLAEDPHMNIDAALNEGPRLGLPDILYGWPKLRYVNSAHEAHSSGKSQSNVPSTLLDESQVEALRHILTKRLAIIQGPPGTGKTHVSVVALKILLENRKLGSAPIIVTAQTNHALDQLLRHIEPIVPDFIRMGGQTKDLETIEPRTLFRVKERDEKRFKDLRDRLHSLRRLNVIVSKEIRELLRPLMNDEPIDPRIFLEYKLISQDQYDSLIDADEDWVGDIVKGPAHSIITWSEDHVRPFERRPLRVRPIESVEYENDDDLRDALLDQGVFDRDEELNGTKFFFKPGYAASGGLHDSERQIKELLRRHKDLYHVPTSARAPMYAWLQSQLFLRLRDRIRSLAKTLQARAKEIKLARMRLDAAFLKDAPVIGLTTTGLSKYRGLLHSLQPKIVLIEEAAETQEAYVTAACFESLEQLILVGDHQQLQAHCQNKDMETFNLQYSMFERLVKHNDLDFRQLTKQRRMLPEMRAVMNIIYPALTDHPCVTKRADVLGMGGCNTWFMQHSTTESMDDYFSYQNEEEAHLVAGFYHYLVANGTPIKEITILTFYNGQKRKIITALRRRDQSVHPKEFNVFTVDSYQGEENEIIILSLVRSNDENKIGFLSVRNRVCVALSRARRGFYMFGNLDILYQKNKLWNDIASVYAGRSYDGPPRIGKHLPLICQKHGKKTKISSSADWGNNDGGCHEACLEQLDCGHACPLHCHPQSHEALGCNQDCMTKLGCGHPCARACGQVPCECIECKEMHRAYAKELRERREKKRANKPPRPRKLDFLPSDEEDDFDLNDRLVEVDDVPEPEPEPKKLIKIQGEEMKRVTSRLSESNINAIDDATSGVLPDTRTESWLAGPVHDTPDKPESTFKEASMWQNIQKQKKEGIKSYQAFARGGVTEDDKRVKSTLRKEASKRMRTVCSQQNLSSSLDKASELEASTRNTCSVKSKAETINTDSNSSSLTELTPPQQLPAVLPTASERIKGSKTIRTEEWRPAKFSSDGSFSDDVDDESISNGGTGTQSVTQLATLGRPPTQSEIDLENKVSHELIEVNDATFPRS